MFTPSSSNLTSIFFRWVGSTTNYIVHILFLRNHPWPPKLPIIRPNIHPPPSTFDEKIFFPMVKRIDRGLGFGHFEFFEFDRCCDFECHLVSAGLMWLDGRRRRSCWVRGEVFLGCWREVEFGGMDGWKMVEKRGLLQSFGLEVLKNLFFLFRNCVWNTTSFGTNIVLFFINTSFNEHTSKGSYVASMTNTATINITLPTPSSSPLNIHG